jgi:transposase-like protein
MSIDAGVIRDYFGQLGLGHEIANLYVALYAHGAQSISELSRSSGVERTRLYRLVETLKSSNLVEVEVRYKRTILRAAPLENLQILLDKKDEELRNLRQQLPHIQQVLQQGGSAASPIKVQVYNSLEGIKQMLWNETRATAETRAILYENMQGYTNSAFFERWVRAINRDHKLHRGIVGDHFIASQKRWYARKENERVANWESRYAPADLFPITHSLVQYDDVTAYYHFVEGNVFGVEVHNEQIATTNRALFELVWRQSQPLGKEVSQQLKPK